MEINEPWAKTSVDSSAKTFIPVQQNVIPERWDKILSIIGAKQQKIQRIASPQKSLDSITQKTSQITINKHPIPILIRLINKISNEPIPVTIRQPRQRITPTNIKLPKRRYHKRRINLIINKKMPRQHTRLNRNQRRYLQQNSFDNRIVN